MANINEPEPALRPGNNAQAGNLPNLLNRVPLLDSQRMDDPRAQGFFSTYRTIFCPSLKLVSFIFVVSVLDILVYCFSLCYSACTGGLETRTGRFLAPSNSTLLDFGAKVRL